MLLDAAAASGTRVLLSYSDGAPALVERPIGAGRSMFLTTTIDRDWSDLPFETSYLPLTQHLLLYLSGRLEQPARSSLIVGESRRIDVGRDVKAIEVTGPDGAQTRFEGADLAGGHFRFHDTSKRGIYTITQIRRQGQDETRFAANIDPQESATASADRGEVERLLRSGRPRTAATAPNLPTPAPERKGNLWPAVLLGLFVLLGFETWLAWQTA